MKKLFSVVLSMLLLAGCFHVNAFAQESTDLKVSHTYTTTEDFASDDWTVDLRGAYLGNGTTTISRADSNHIHISGSTNATRTCDKVVLTLYVERSTSYATGYGNFKTYRYNAQNVYQLAKEISNIQIERGYYYRVSGVHSVTHNGTIETTNSVTDPIDFR